MLVEKIGRTVDDGLIYHLENAGIRMRGYPIGNEVGETVGWTLINEQGEEAFYADYQEMRDALELMDTSGYLNGTRSLRESADPDTSDLEGEECPF